MNLPRAVPSGPGGWRPPGDMNFAAQGSAASLAAGEAMTSAILATQASRGDRSTVVAASHEIAITAVSLLMILTSLIGDTWAVLLYIPVAALCASKRIGNSALLAIASVILILNTFVLPAVLLRATAGSITWAWLPLWFVEGLFLNWVLVTLFRSSAAAGPAQEPSPGSAAGGNDRGSVRLLMESSSQSQERFRLMVESLGDYAIVMLDLRGNVASWNVGAERILGYTASEVLGCDHSLFFLPEDPRRGIPQRSLETAVEEGRFEFEGWQRRKDHGRLWAHLGVTPMRSSSGALLGFATVIRDITQKRRAEESLRQARDELEVRVR